MISEIKSEQLTPPESNTPPLGGPKVEGGGEGAVVVPEDEAKAAVAQALSSQAASANTEAPQPECAPVEVPPVPKAEAVAASDLEAVHDSELWDKVRLIQSKALALLASWSSLAEVFKIPRKVLRAEHEREAEEAEAVARLSEPLASEAGSKAAFAPASSVQTENRKRSYERSRDSYHHQHRPQVSTDLIFAIVTCLCLSYTYLTSICKHYIHQAFIA